MYPDSTQLSSETPTTPAPSQTDSTTAPSTVVEPPTGAATQDVVAAPAETTAAPAAAPALKAGDLVSHTYFDPYIGAGGEEVSVSAIVIAVKDDKALVSFLPVSGPIPVDELDSV